MYVGIMIFAICGFLTVVYLVLVLPMTGKKTKPVVDGSAWDKIMSVEKTEVPLPKSYQAVEERVERADGSISQTRKINVWN